MSCGHLRLEANFGLLLLWLDDADDAPFVCILREDVNCQNQRGKHGAKYARLLVRRRRVG
jgi:hypothetical protein